jgi:hypothetical protein
MSSLRFGMPEGITDEMEMTLAAIQTWAGKLEGAGRWTDVQATTEEPLASYFSSSAGTWTVGAGVVQAFRYAIVQEMLFFRVIVSGSSTSAGMGNDLRVRLPGGFRTTDNGYLGPVQWDDSSGGGVSGIGSVFGLKAPQNNVVRLVRDVLPASTAWPSALTSSFSVRLNLTIPIISEGDR